MNIRRTVPLDHCGVNLPAAPRQFAPRRLSGTEMSGTVSQLHSQAEPTTYMFELIENVVGSWHLFSQPKRIRISLCNHKSPSKKSTRNRRKYILDSRDSLRRALASAGKPPWAHAGRPEKCLKKT